MIDLLFRKRRGVNVKAKLKLLVATTFVTVMLLNAYLINLNASSNRTIRANGTKSTANYVDLNNRIAFKEIEQEQNEEVVEEIEEVKEEPILYEGKTMEEVSSLLNVHLGSTLTGKGDLIANYSIQKGVDPYLATAIILQETGCKWGCSYLVNACNNVGGQKGTGCGGYSYFESLDSGIMAFIDNIYNNYVSYGLLTADQMNPKYAEDPNWSNNVNKYIEILKAQ